jgi:hypothetical protein
MTEEKQPKNHGNTFARKGETNLDSLIKFRVSKEDKAAFFKAANGMKIS